MILSIKPWRILRKKDAASVSHRSIRVIDLYLGVNLLGISFFILGILLVVALLSQSLKLINFITDYGAPLFVIFPLFFASAPYWLELVLPFAFAFATMSVYHQLELNSELTVMRASGISNLRLVMPQLVVGGIFVLIGYGFSLYLSPLSQTAFRDIQRDLKKQAAFVPIREGRFTNISEKVIIYVPRRDSSGAVASLFIHDNRNDAQPVTILAQQGQLVRSDEGIRLSLVDGSYQTLSRKNLSLSLLDFEEYDMLLDAAEQDSAIVRKPRERFFGELFAPSANAQLWAEGHQRLFRPFFPLVFGLIVTAFMLSAHYERRRRIKPMVLACLTLAMMKFLTIAFLYSAGHYAAWVIVLTYFLLFFASVLALWHIIRPQQAEQFWLKRRGHIIMALRSWRLIRQKAE